MHALARVNFNDSKKVRGLLCLLLCYVENAFHISGAAALAILNSIGRLHKIQIC
jgi:hypothetical protein